MSSKLLLVAIFVVLLSSSVSATTYFVSKNGDDNASGTSWQSAWTSLDKVNGSVNGGDTVFFATGIWRGQLFPATGSYSDRTCYACSSFADVNGDGEYHFAKIWGSDSATGWTQIGSSNVYRTTSYGYSGFTAGYQGDSLLILQPDSASVNSPGEFWTGSGRIIAYAYNLGPGYDPDNYNMEFSQTNPIVNMNGSGSYSTLYGLEFKYSAAHVMLWGTYPDEVQVDSAFVINCKLSHAYGWAGENPSLIGSGNTGSDNSTHDYNLIRACSLGYVWAYYPNPWDIAGTHGSATCFYLLENSTIDSCSVYGFFSLAGIFFKNDAPIKISNNIIRFNDITTTHGAGMLTFNYIDGMEIYGNVFHDCANALYIRLSGCSDCGRILTRNNTFYNCTNPLTHASESTYPELNCEFKYNVIYNDGSQQIYVQTEDSDASTGWDIDSNLVFTGGSLTLRTSGTTRSLSEWQNSFNHDERSNFGSNPGLAGPEFGDFSRPAATSEMNRIYRGRLWTIYGAWQPGDPIIELDTISPGTIQDVGAVPGTNHGEINLTLTPPGDDGQDGLASRYEIMWSLEPITLGGFVAGTTVFGAPSALTLSGLEPGQQYYIAIIAYDEAGNASGLSNQPYSFAGGILTPPALVTEVSEENLTATLSCDAVVSYYNPITYDFSVLDTAAGQTYNLNVSQLTGSRAVAVFENLDPDAYYFWQCRAVSPGADSSDWSDQKRFRLSNIPPDPPVASFPLDDDTVTVGSSPFLLTVVNSVDFDGSAPLTYDFELSIAGSASILASESFVAEGNNVTSWTVPVALDAGIEYIWRSRSFDGEDYSDWMEWASFVLVGFTTGTEAAEVQIIAYPNPISFASGDLVTFRLPDEPVDLLIQSVSGTTVVLKTGISGDWQWDGRNDDGREVAVGIYSWFVRGTGQNGKILVKP